MTPAEIAARLTPLQGRALLAAQHGLHTKSWFIVGDYHGNTLRGLWRRGLLAQGYLSPLGAAVRAVLAQQGGGDE